MHNYSFILLLFFLIIKVLKAFTFQKKKKKRIMHELLEYAKAVNFEETVLNEEAIQDYYSADNNSQVIS